VIRVPAKAGPPKEMREILDVLISELALTRRKLESLIELMDEKGLVSNVEFRNKLKEKSEEEKLQILMESLSLTSLDE